MTSRIGELRRYWVATKARHNKEWIRIQGIVVPAEDYDALADKNECLIGQRAEWQHRAETLGKQLDAAQAELAALKDSKNKQRPIAWVTIARKPGVTEQRSLWHGEDGADQWISHFQKLGCETKKIPLYELEE